MAAENINKVIYGGQTLIDLTNDSITESDVLNGKTFHGADGSIKTGTSTYDADTSDATATEDEILATKTAYVNGVKKTGQMPNRGSVSGVISTVDSEFTIANGYHDGSGKIGISATEKAKIIASNIRQGVSILGIEGTMSGTEDVNAQEKAVTPYTTAQTILPDTGYNYLSQVNVAAISYTETENAAGGLTVTIGTVAPA